MDTRKLVMALAVLLVVVAAAYGLSLSQTKDTRPGEAKAELASKEEGKEEVEDICSSSTTYARLKQVAFEEAVRIRNADPANLDTLATHSIVRMESPVVKSRDEELNLTVCSGRFVLELPPGAERAFGGERRLTADIEYAAQNAADGSGLVFQMEGAEPIIYKLAAFDLQRQRVPGGGDEIQFAEADVPATGPVPSDGDIDPADAPPVAVDRPEPAPAPKAAPAPRPRPRAPEPEPKAEREREPVEVATPRILPPERIRTRNGSNPSFSCRSARTPSERLVCSSNRLAAKDRAMSSQFYSALANADAATKRELRRTRDRFLAYRERCGSEACVAEAYDGRMAEIRDIMAAQD